MDELDWGAASVLCSSILQNMIHHVHAASFSIALPYSMGRSCTCVYFNFEICFTLQEHCMDKISRSSCAPVQFILPGNLPLCRNCNCWCKIRTTLLPKLITTLIFPRNLVHQNWNAFSRFCSFFCISSHQWLRKPLIFNEYYFYI